MLISIVSFIAVFSLLAFAHELGHFLVAKRSGVKVDEFGIGFPPRLFTIGERAGTIFTINALPLGGFVRMVGEDDPGQPGGLAGQSKLVRVKVLSAGAAMNLLLAVLLFSLTAVIGQPVAITGVEVAKVASASPAAQAGMKTGDLVLEFNGLEISDALALQRLTYQNLGREVTLLLKRNEQSLSVVLTPREFPPEGEGPMGIGMGTKVLGTRLVQYNLLQALPMGAANTSRAIGVIVLGVIYMVRGLITPDLAGPIGIAQVTGQVAQMGFPFLLQFTAFLSVNLALINVLPFPGLDGGRLLFVALEAIRGKRMDPEKEGLVHAVGMLVLIGLVFVVSYFDILRIVGGS